ncbi:MAG: MerR family transcriptional regulator [Succinivibrionaceae bacterium]|jgi:DNA-binding transcriptional MerR regulator|nr:MerR family transcriptional regulator [Succinivibrionaceae bacterium]
MTISEICKKFDISSDTLRYYEKIGLLPKISRTKGGIRDYSQNDCNWIEFIKCMRAAGISIEKLVEYVNLFNQGDSTILQRKQILIEEREKIIEKLGILQNSLERLNYKIEHYDDLVLKCESGLNSSK